jgi:transcriptional regulator with XRE-family HTH domain
MDVSLLIKQRLTALGLEQRALASAAQVTESYISQIVNGRKAPPAPERTDLYPKMEAILRLQPGRLATLADLQRKEAVKKKLGALPTPLLKDVRELILRTCAPETARTLAPLFAREPLGALERFVTQHLLDLVKRIATQGLEDERWLRRVTRRRQGRYRQMRVAVLDFLETDLFNLTADHCATFLEPLIVSWDIDLTTFAMDVALSRPLAGRRHVRYELVERDADTPAEEPGFLAFLRDRTLSDGATAEEIAFLRTLRFTRLQPTPLYYYRELQNLRDPLHFDVRRARTPPRSRRSVPRRRSTSPTAASRDDQR